MKGIDPKTCIHHIYIEENSRPTRQPQRMMNPKLREIVKEELQKLLNVNFIYPISDSRWVSPLVIVPKKDDASDTALGAVLGQKDFVPYAIYYTSTNLTPTELNYTVTEKDFSAVVHAINKFRHYITGYETFIHTDHSAIRYLMNKPVTNGRVTRWLLLLQEFNITVLDRPGKQNTVADFLSRIQNTKEDSPIEDKFPDKYLFAVTTKTPWYPDIANYLVTGKLPPHLLPSEKRNIIQESSKYSWISNKLFKAGPDLMIRRCVREDEIPNILKACHDEPCGGNFADKRIAYKILPLGYFWPSLFKDAKQYVKRCDSCQRVGKPTLSNEMPLKP
eukprot:PITA_17990